MVKVKKRKNNRNITKKFLFFFIGRWCSYKSENKHALSEILLNDYYNNKSIKLNKN